MLWPPLREIYEAGSLLSSVSRLDTLVSTPNLNSTHRQRVGMWMEGNERERGRLKDRGKGGERKVGEKKHRMEKIVRLLEGEGDEKAS